MKYLSGCLLMLLLGCDDRSKSEFIPIENVPENIIAVAREKLPGVTFDQAVKGPDGRYEVIGKDKKGKIREVEISADGEVLLLE